MRTGHKQGKMRLTCFSLDWHSSRSRTAVSPKLFAFTVAGTQVSPVTMSQPYWRAAALPCLLLFIKKKPTEGGLEAFLGFLPLAFTLGFCLWLLLWDFGVGSFWKGKELLKGKEFLKRNC
jgi:hypothetical protein